MKTGQDYPISISSTFLWIGFVLAISFMEAWLKFQAPGVTVTLGLGIGKLVFRALNYVEWFFIILIFVSTLLRGAPFFQRKHIFYCISALIVLLQTTWLLPELDARANMLIAGKDPGNSSLHFIYVGMEVLKVICLFIFGISLLKKR